MLKLTVQVIVHLTANTSAELERWAALFIRLLGSCNRQDTCGTWVGAKGVETETDVSLRWLAEDFDTPKFRRLLRYLRLYHLAAHQEAVLLEINGTGYLIFQADWDCPKTVQELVYAFDPGLALADWFDQRAEIDQAARYLEQGWGA